jgi:flavin reductase (DIM6/NTAB) family NADH-FMN oxidoreductase RutF
MAEIDLKVFRDFTYGLYIITSHDGDRLNGQLVNTVMQVTSDPARISVTVNKKNLTHEFMVKSGSFVACVVEEDVTLKFLGPFGFRSGRDFDKFKDLKFSLGKNGCPIVEDHVLSWVEAKVINIVDIGTHSIFIGDVENAAVLKEGKPLTYVYYHQNLKGKTSPNAPTFGSQ